MEKIYELTKQGRKTVDNLIAELTAKRKELLDAGKDTASFELPTAEDIIKEVEQEFGLADYEGFFSSTDNDEPMHISLKPGRDFIKAGVQELSFPVQTKYGEGKLTATVDKDSGQISITYQTPETGDTVDLALVETRNKDNCPIFCNPKPDDNEVASFAIRVYADPYDEDYTNGFDVYVNEVQESVVGPDEIRDSTKM